MPGQKPGQSAAGSRKYNHRVPFTIFKAVKVLIAVAVKQLDVFDFFRRMPAAIKKRHLVMRGKRSRHQVPT
jgi:hypothetical protein